MAAYGVGAQVGVLLPFSRLQESEADRLGLIFMAMAGYDPREALDFWQRMSEASQGGAPPEFLSTHPSHETRIQRIRDYLPEAMSYYRK
jgi:predicted Zn-dependent protease